MSWRADVERRRRNSLKERSRQGLAGRSVATRAAAPARSWSPSRSAEIALGLILIATIWLFVPALRTEFFADDYLFLDQVRERSLWQAIVTPDPLSNFFRPVSRQIYFWVVAGLTNESPVAFHIGNLALLLVSIALLFAIARRFGGTLAGAISAGILALHYTADIPVRWACGSQELFAVSGALAAILLHLKGHTRWAGVMLVIAALSKEVILLTPAIAVFADRRAREPWSAAARRAWPLGAAVLVWALIFLSMPQRRVAQSTEVEYDLVSSPIAAFVHLAQVTLGAEWRQGEPFRLPTVLPPIVPLALVIGGVLVATRAAAAAMPSSAKAPNPSPQKSDRARPQRDAASRAPGRPVLRHLSPEARHGVWTGIVWALLGTVPVIAVALLWSAYYYLFAMCGVALALGILLAHRRTAVAVAALVVLAWGSASARELGEFAVARDAWTPSSHINRHYVDRSNRIVDRYLASLRNAYPELPDGSTLFFAGLKGNVAFQRANGPLLRWAYRDSSLRSYYLNAFSLDKLRSGPMFVFVAAGDTLRELEGGDDLFQRIAFGMLVSDQPKSARDALTVSIEREGDTPRTRLWRGWAAYASGDTSGAITDLAAGGAEFTGGPWPETREFVMERLAAGDTAGAIVVMKDVARRRPLDAGAHGLLADLLLIRDRRDPDAAIEALAARVLAPNDPFVWRRWAMIQLDRERQLEALASFDRYFALGGQTAANDTEARGYADHVRSILPGGDVAPEELRR